MISSAVRSRFAGLLVLGLVLTSFPARVWLFGACPVCGGIHQPILLAHVGNDGSDPTLPPAGLGGTSDSAPQPGQGEDPSDDPPTSPHDDRLAGQCVPPLPYCPTAATGEPAAALVPAGELRPESDPLTAPVPAFSLIRPPRA